MAIDVAVGVGNMCMSRRWKAEHVTSRIHVQTLARFVLLRFLNLTIHLYIQSVQKLSSTLS
jgi:hypothetical protein